MTARSWVLGVDGSARGWVGVAWGGHDDVRAFFGATIADLVSAAEADLTVTVVAVDIPIGLPDSSIRLADRATRAELGPRRSSVFPAPVRSAVEAATYAEAASVNRGLTGKGLSAQAYALSAKIRDVDRFVRVSSVRVVEVHPEASFSALAGGPLPSSKHSWNGVGLRAELLAGAGLRVPAGLEGIGDRCAVDDVLDAGAAAWTGLRVARGSARCVPDPPEVFSDGWPAAIWV